MTLKTLKDIHHRIWTNEETNVFTNNEIRETLKAEAVKHIKDIKEEIDGVLKEIQLAVENKDINEAKLGLLVVSHYQSKIEWIKHFFNITGDEE